MRRFGVGVGGVSRTQHGHSASYLSGLLAVGCLPFKFQESGSLAPNRVQEILAAVVVETLLLQPTLP